jgi:hypothetical protein
VRRLALLLLTAACGQSPIRAGDFPAEFARAVCKVEARCRNEARYLEQRCEEETAALYEPDLAKAMARGKARFDPTEAQSCLDGLRKRGCEDAPPETSQACERAVTGTVTQGQGCDWIFECATGRCEPATPGECPATCRAAGPEGASCTDIPCDLRAGLRCISSVCSRLHAAGESCKSPSDCAAGLFCSALELCVPRAAEQASCDSDAECAAGLFCDLSREGGLCRKRFAQGEACTTGLAEAIDFACADGLVCRGFIFRKAGSTPGTCAPPGEAGATCVAGADVSGCAGGLLCAAGTCADKPVSGPCTVNEDCKDGVAYCDGSACRLLLAEGASCTDSTQCAEGFCDPASSSCGSSDPTCHER